MIPCVLLTLFSVEAVSNSHEHQNLQSVVNGKTYKVGTAHPKHKEHNYDPPSASKAEGVKETFRVKQENDETNRDYQGFKKNENLVQQFRNELQDHYENYQKQHQKNQQEVSKSSAKLPTAGIIEKAQLTAAKAQITAKMADQSTKMGQLQAQLGTMDDQLNQLKNSHQKLSEANSAMTTPQYAVGEASNELSGASYELENSTQETTDRQRFYAQVTSEGSIGPAISENQTTQTQTELVDLSSSTPETFSIGTVGTSRNSTYAQAVKNAFTGSPNSSLENINTELNTSTISTSTQSEPKSETNVSEGSNNTAVVVSQGGTPTTQEESSSDGRSLIANQTVRNRPSRSLSSVSNHSSSKLSSTSNTNSKKTATTVVSKNVQVTASRSGARAIALSRALSQSNSSVDPKLRSVLSKSRSLIGGSSLKRPTRVEQLLPMRASY